MGWSLILLAASLACTLRAASAWSIHSFAGTTEHGLHDGNATSAQFDSPGGLIVSPDNTMYVADTRNAVIRVVKSFTVSTMVLSNNEVLQKPTGLALSNTSSTLFIADKGANDIFAVDLKNPTQFTSLLKNHIESPVYIAVHSDNHIVMTAHGSNQVFFVLNCGPKDTDLCTCEFEGYPDVPMRCVLAIGTKGKGRDDYHVITSSFDTPMGLATDSDGNIFVADTGNDAIRKITFPYRLDIDDTTTFLTRFKAGFVTTLTISTPRQPWGLALSPDESVIFVTDPNRHAVTAINVQSPGDMEDCVIGASKIGDPGAIAALSRDIVYVIDGNLILILMRTFDSNSISFPLYVLEGPGAALSSGGLMAIVLGVVGMMIFAAAAIKRRCIARTMSGCWNRVGAVPMGYAKLPKAHAPPAYLETEF